MLSLLKDTDQILCRIYFQLPRSLKLFLISFWPFKLQLFEPLEGYKMCCKSLNYIHRNWWGNATNVRFGKMVVAENSGSTELSSKVCWKFYIYFTVSSDRIIAIRTYFRHFMCIVSHQKLFFLVQCSVRFQTSGDQRTQCRFCYELLVLVNSFSQMKSDVILILSTKFLIYTLTVERSSMILLPLFLITRFTNCVG